ncbi:hypothetical protein RJ640_005789, partial [Escallonia rubra]
MVALLEDIVQSVELWLRLIKKPQPYVDPSLDPVLLVPGIAGKSVSLDPKTRISVPDDRFGLYAIDVLDPDMLLLALPSPAIAIINLFKQKSLCWLIFHASSSNGDSSSSPAIISTTAPLFVTLDCFKGEEKASGLYFAVGSNIPCIDLRPGEQVEAPMKQLAYTVGDLIIASPAYTSVIIIMAIGCDSVYYFHDMIFEMIRWGYKEGKTLFGFGYDFRQSNRFEETLDCLAAKLESAYTASGGKKIIVISHSMGGLLVKCFMSLRSNIFEKYVKNWIAIAAPFQ